MSVQSGLEDFLSASVLIKVYTSHYGLCLESLFQAQFQPLSTLR